MFSKRGKKSSLRRVDRSLSHRMVDNRGCMHAAIVELASRVLSELPMMFMHVTRPPAGLVIGWSNRTLLHAWLVGVVFSVPVVLYMWLSIYMNVSFDYFLQACKKNDRFWESRPFLDYSENRSFPKFEPRTFHSGSGDTSDDIEHKTEFLIWWTKRVTWFDSFTIYVY